MRLLQLRRKNLKRIGMSAKGSNKFGHNFCVFKFPQSTIHFLCKSFHFFPQKKSLELLDLEPKDPYLFYYSIS